MESREATAAALQAASGAAFIPPYNHGAVMCGQGTMALEFMDQVRTEGGQRQGLTDGARRRNMPLCWIYR